MSLKKRASRVGVGCRVSGVGDGAAATTPDSRLPMAAPLDQRIMRAFPSTASFGSTPQLRLSRESARLSPRTKYESAGGVWGATAPPAPPAAPDAARSAGPPTTPPAGRGSPRHAGG